MNDLIERLRASENQIAQPGYLSLATRSRIEEELHQAADDLSRLRQPVTGKEVQSQVAHLRRLSESEFGHIWGQSLQIAADLIDRLARSEAELRDSNMHWQVTYNSCIEELKEARAELVKAKVDAERYRWLRENWDDITGLTWHLPIGTKLDAHIDAAVDAARAGAGAGNNEGEQR